MITREEIAKLTPKGRTHLFDDLSGLLFATQEQCATALEVTRFTLNNWRKADNVPLMALLALHSMAEGKLAADLTEIADRLASAAAILERLVSPASSRAAPSGSGGKNSAAPRATGASAR